MTYIILVDHDVTPKIHQNSKLSSSYVPLVYKWVKKAGHLLVWNFLKVKVKKNGQRTSLSNWPKIGIWGPWGPKHMPYQAFSWSPHQTLVIDIFRILWPKLHHFYAYNGQITSLPNWPKIGIWDPWGPKHMPYQAFSWSPHQTLVIDINNINQFVLRSSFYPNWFIWVRKIVTKTNI